MFDEIAALVLRRRDERDRDVTLAWMTVNLAAQTWAKGRVPDLQDLLSHGRQERRQTMDEQRAILQLLSQRIGRPLRTTADRTKARMTRKAAS